MISYAVNTFVNIGRAHVWTPVTTSITTSNGIEKDEKLFSTVTNNVTVPQGLSPAPSFSFAAKPTDWVQQGERWCNFIYFFVFVFYFYFYFLFFYFYFFCFCFLFLFFIFYFFVFYFFIFVFCFLFFIFLFLFSIFIFYFLFSIFYLTFSSFF